MRLNEFHVERRAQYRNRNSWKARSRARIARRQSREAPDLVVEVVSPNDLAEETFIKAWYRLPRIRDEKRFRGWLYKIATNAALDHKRSKSSRKRGSQPAESLNEDYSNEYRASFEGQVEEQELIELSLKQLASRPRACLLLYQEGFSQEEIAELTGMKTKSVGTYISMAREQFRRAYNHLKDL